MTGPRIAAIGVVVSDMAATVAFYRRVGVSFPDDAPGQPHVEADLGGVKLMLDTEDVARQIDPDWTAPGAGRVAFAAQLADPEAVDSLYAELAADGFGVKGPWDAFWGQRYSTVHDPDGTHVDLYAALPT